ncbi:hypothetical protein N7456_006758 [Penicillium angulare]|uniref:Uncharacterized protein n=1 Tax=Penicillium angulare TaxID=116970 RepID=A0A9W9FIA2_9EURO|nr:hypothetical protein N7456_006758 [Penicillium angulare]
MKETTFNFNSTESDLPRSHLELNSTSTGNTRENPFKFDLTEEIQPKPKPRSFQPIPTFRGSLFQDSNTRGSPASTGSSSERPVDSTEGKYKSTSYLAQPVPIAPGSLFQSLPSHGRSVSTDNSRENPLGLAERHRRESSFEPALPTILQPGGLFSGGVFPDTSSSIDKTQGERLFTFSQKPRAASASRPAPPAIVQPGGFFSGGNSQTSTASTEGYLGEGLLFSSGQRPRAASASQPAPPAIRPAEGLFSGGILLGDYISKDKSRDKGLFSLSKTSPGAPAPQGTPQTIRQPEGLFSGGIFSASTASTDNSQSKELFPLRERPRTASTSQTVPLSNSQPRGLFQFPAEGSSNSAASTYKPQSEEIFPCIPIPLGASASQPTHLDPRSIFQDSPRPNNANNNSLFSKSSSQTLTPDHRASTYADLHTSTPTPESRRKIAPVSPRHSRRGSSTVSTSTVNFDGSPGPKTPNTGSISSYSTTASIIDDIFRNTPSINTPSIVAPSARTPSVNTPSVNTPPMNRSSMKSSPISATSTSSADEPTMAESSSRKSNSEADTMESFREENSYSVRQESLPKAPVYDQGLQRGLAEVKNSLRNIASIMGDSDLAHDSDSHFNTLYHETKSLSNFRYPETRIVGFIGDSGVGKSSLVNSLLDEPNLARSGGGGSACTSLVTEFRSADDNHLQAYTIEVHFMASDDIRELLEELLRNFRAYYCDSLFREIESPDEREKCKTEAGKAWMALESLFSDQHELTHDFLSKEGSGAWEAAMTKLQTWANAAVAGRSGDGQSLVSKVPTGSLQGCKDYLDHLSAESHDNGDPALWPFIKLIRVYLKSPILRTGLVVTDLPGFRDLNYARVRATEKYLSHSCDEVFILTGIMRAESDLSIVDIKNRCPSKPQHIVCTRSEEVNAEEEARSTEAFAPRVRTMNEKIRKSKDKLRSVKLNMRKGSASERGEYALKYTELLRTKYLIETRNTKVTAKLRNTYAGMETFCVSNTLYANHRDDEPRLAESYIALSGVRRLREHCQLVPAKAQLRAVSAYLRHQVPAHLGSLRQWILAGADAVSNETAPVLREALEEVELILRRELLLRGGYVDKIRRDLIDEFNQVIITYAQASNMILGDYQVPWTNQAVLVSQEWATSQNDNSEHTVAEIFQRLSNLLGYNERHAPQSIGNLLISLESREQNIAHEIEGCFYQIIRSTDITSNDMIGGHASSFIGDLMRPAYLECNREGGSGSDARRKAIMHRHISGPQIFREYGNLAKTYFTAAMNECFAKLHETLVDQVDGISRDLHTVIAEDGETTEAEQSPEVSSQLGPEVGNAQGVLERVQRVLYQIEANSS